MRATIELVAFLLALLGLGLVGAGLAWLGLRYLDGSHTWADARFVWIGLVVGSFGVVLTRLAARRAGGST